MKQASARLRYALTVCTALAICVYHLGHLPAPDIFVENNDAAGPWADGNYEGEAEGYGGMISLQVTIENGWMTQIDILDASGEDRPYLRDAKAIIPQVLSAQHTDLDAISGATTTTWGILDAIDLALEAAGS